MPTSGDLSLAAGPGTAASGDLGLARPCPLPLVLCLKAGGIASGGPTSSKTIKSPELRLRLLPFDLVATTSSLMAAALASVFSIASFTALIAAVTQGSTPS